MTNVAIVYEIPPVKVDGVPGGKLYDTFGNFSSFADVSGLTTSETDNSEKEVSYAKHTREKFMRDPAPANIPARTAKYVAGIQRAKGGLPGFTVTFQATIDGKVEKRDFTFDGAVTGLWLWMTENCKQDTLMWGKTGNPYELITKKEA